MANTTIINYNQTHRLTAAPLSIALCTICILSPLNECNAQLSRINNNNNRDGHHHHNWVYPPDRDRRVYRAKLLSSKHLLYISLSSPSFSFTPSFIRPSSALVAYLYLYMMAKVFQKVKDFVIVKEPTHEEEEADVWPSRLSFSFSTH